MLSNYQHQFTGLVWHRLSMTVSVTFNGVYGVIYGWPQTHRANYCVNYQAQSFPERLSAAIELPTT
jgi:hypothetical protein